MPGYGSISGSATGMGRAGGRATAYRAERVRAQLVCLLLTPDRRACVRLWLAAASSLPGGAAMAAGRKTLALALACIAGAVLLTTYSR